MGSIKGRTWNILAKPRHGNNIKKQNDNELNGDPDSDVDGMRPVLDDDGAGGGLGGDEDGVRVPVVPAVGEGQAGVQEAADEVGYRDAFHGQEGCHLGQHIHDHPDHAHHDDVGHEQRRRTHGREDLAAAHEEACSDAVLFESHMLGRLVMTDR